MRHKEHLKEEHMRHGERMHHESAMHEMSGRKSNVYEHEVDKPAMPKEGHLIADQGMREFLKDADPIAYGQASMEGCKADHKRMTSQFKEYHWD